MIQAAKSTRQRGALSIRILILEAARRKRHNRTAFLEELVLNYNRVIAYTDRMFFEGLLDYDNADRSFGITTKGLQYLKLSEELAHYVSDLDLLLDKYRIRE